LKIPEKFHNSLTEAPFAECQVCSKQLGDNEEYMIEKAYHRDLETGGEQLVFEYAICRPCAEKLRATLSKESLSNIEGFFMEKAVAMREEGSFIDNHQIDRCMLSGKPTTDCQEYQIYAHCIGSQLKPMEGMYMLSEEIMEEVQELISEETRDELDRFSETYLGGPPELEELFSGKRLILV